MRGITSGITKGITRGITFSDDEGFSPNQLSGMVLWLDATVPSSVLVDSGVQLTANNLEYLSVTSNASLQVGTNDFTIAGWFYCDDVSTTRTIAAKTGGANQEWMIRVQAGGTLYFYYYTPGANSINSTGGAISINTWYHVVVKRESGTMSMIISNGTPITRAVSGTLTVSSNAFTFGSQSNGVNYHDGRLDSWGLWNGRGLSASEITELYNLGAGLNYAGLSAGLLSGLTSWWDMDEVTGTRNDSHGTNHVTEVKGSFITTSTNNGGFETAGGGGADVFGSWTESVAGTSTITDDAVDFDTGAHSCKFTIDGAGSAVSVTQTLLVVGKTYSYSVRAKSALGGATIRVGSTANYNSHLLNASYATYASTFTADTTSFTIFCNSTSATANIDGVTIASNEIVDVDGIVSGQATVNDPVSSWRDISGNNNHFTQSSLASRPTLKAAQLNTQNGIEFDAVDDVLTSSINFDAYADMTCFYVMKRDGTTTQFVLNEQSPSQAMFAFSNATIYAGRYNQPACPSGLGTGISAIYSTQDNLVWVNGAATTPGSTTAFNPVNLTVQIGARNTSPATQFFQGKIAEIILYNRALSDGERRLVELYLSIKYGIAVV